MNDDIINFYLNIENIKTVYEYLIDKKFFKEDELEDYLYLTEIKQVLIKHYYFGYDNMIDFIEKELKDPSSKSDIKMRIIKTISYMHINIDEDQKHYKINKTFHVNYNIGNNKIAAKYYNVCLKDLYLFYKLHKKTSLSSLIHSRIISV
jgi:hypothetical protein